MSIEDFCPFFFTLYNIDRPFYRFRQEAQLDNRHETAKKSNVFHDFLVFLFGRSSATTSPELCRYWLTTSPQLRQTSPNFAATSPNFAATGPQLVHNWLKLGHYSAITRPLLRQASSELRQNSVKTPSSSVRTPSELRQAPSSSVISQITFQIKS